MSSHSGEKEMRENVLFKPNSKAYERNVHVVNVGKATTMDW